MSRISPSPAGRQGWVYVQAARLAAPGEADFGFLFLSQDPERHPSRPAPMTALFLWTAGRSAFLTSRAHRSIPRHALASTAPTRPAIEPESYRTVLSRTISQHRPDMLRAVMRHQRPMAISRHLLHCRFSTYCSRSQLFEASWNLSLMALVFDSVVGATEIVVPSDVLTVNAVTVCDVMAMNG